MAGVQEENRRRIALSLLALGGLLIATGVVIWIVSQNAMNANAVGGAGLETNRIRVSHETQTKMIKQVLFMLILLVVILCVSLLTLKLWSRRFRQALFRKPAPPTPSEDVWAMHKLPEELLPETDDPDTAPPQPER